MEDREISYRIGIVREIRKHWKSVKKKGSGKGREG
jgi:hypothetical protein